MDKQIWSTRTKDQQERQRRVALTSIAQLSDMERFEPEVFTAQLSDYLSETARLVRARRTKTRKAKVTK